MKERNILFIDGVCSLCDGFAKYILKNSHVTSFYISSLQGKAAQEVLDPVYIKRLETIVYFKNNKSLIESDAVIEILIDSKIIGRLPTLLYYFPKVARDKLYRFISKYRYRIFGKKKYCELKESTQELDEQKRILD
jgi:predicted DCC family thiol-disulfide oxidoreductase YuxK